MEYPIVHHLIAFPAEYFEAREASNIIDKSGDIEAWGDFRNSQLYCQSLIGGTYRGSYLNKQDLIDRIKRATDVYDISEGYYEYLLIESYYLNCIDGSLFDAPSFRESEMWFKFIKIDDENYEYQQIPRPECLVGVCNFL